MLNNKPSFACLNHKSTQKAFMQLLMKPIHLSLNMTALTFKQFTRFKTSQPNVIILKQSRSASEHYKLLNVNKVAMIKKKDVQVSTVDA